MCIQGKKRSLEPVGRDPKKNSGSVWRSGLGTRLEDLVSQVRISHFILWKKDVPQDFRQPVTWSDLVSDGLLWQESRPGLSDGDQNQKNHRRLHQRFLWRMLQAWTYTTRRRASCDGCPWPFPLLWCPQNSRGRGLRQGKCVLQPLRAGGGAQPRGYFLTLKSKAQSCFQSFKNIWHNNPTYGYLVKENENRILKGYLYYHLYCANIYNGQDTNSSIDGWMDKEDVRIYICIISWRHFAKWDNHKEKDKYCIIITYMWSLKKAKLIERESLRMVLTRKAWGWVLRCCWRIQICNYR